MVNFITDGSLVGFWPLDEPSGTAIWKNHSSAFARAPSGVPFDFTVAVADVTNIEEYMSSWPGKGFHVNPESGTTYHGYEVKGSWRLNTDSSPLSRYLILGGGARQCAEEIWEPAVAQSGFTVGFWVYPNSNGYEDFQTTAAPFTSTSWYTEAARCHTLFGAFQANTAQGGWRLGVSGILSRGAQFAFSEPASKQLRAFAFIERTTGAPTDLLSVPIESGRYTHITWTYRFIDGTNNQIVLYKDGQVAASGTTASDLVNTNTSLISASLARCLAIGASDATAAATDEYARTAGWNHLMSGAYFFKRVLHEGEILDMHTQGGLQPTPGNLLPASETKLTSDYLVAYYPFMEPGYGEVSADHRPLVSNYDLGDHTERVLVPGPHGFGASFHNGTTTANYHAVPSGACFEMLNARSWTIGVWFDLQNAANREDNMWLSWGSVTSLTSAASQPASVTLTLNTAGLVGTVSGITNAQRAVVEVYPLGDNKDVVNTRVFNLLGLYEYYNQASAHVAIAYDDSTRGLAVYINGALAESGTLNHSLTDQLLRITGSGFPLMFGNGVLDQVADATTKGLHTTGGLDQWLGPVFLAKKALVGPEIRGIVLSGIVDMPSVYRTRHDPRLVAYWPCTLFDMTDVLVLDEAQCWKALPGHLVRGDTFASDERWYDRDHNETAGTVFRNDGTAFINQFGSRTPPAALASFGNLGITSGIFTVNSASLGAANVDDALDARSAMINLALRYKPVIEERDLSAQNLAGEYIVSFEVTPSGNIPAIDTIRTSNTNEISTNCLLFSLTNHLNTPGAGESDFHIFLTSINATNPDPLGATAGLGGSGITIRVNGAVDTFAAGNIAPLVSGRVPFGVPSRILVHTKFDDPYQVNGITAGNANYTVSLWINGTLIHRFTTTQLNSRIWAAGTLDSALDYCPLQIGGVLGVDVLSQQADWQGGLGDIYMREIFVMKGVFSKGEVEALAASGIQTPSIAGYIDQMPTSQVTIADADLAAYWRFHGFEGGGSGTTDLSLNNNHLFPAAQRYQTAGFGITQAAAFMRMSPAMFANSDLGVQCSGITYSSRQVTSAEPNRIPPFMASGSLFDTPHNGFSVGFFYKKKNVVTAGRTDAILTYGILGTTAVSATDVNYDRGWCILTDDTNNVKMVIATSGNMYLDNADVAAQSGQVVCGVFGEGGKTLEDLRIFDRQAVGDINAARLDSWAHYCWTYDPSDRKVRCYQDGELVDVEDIKHAGPQVPFRPDARYITFLQHSENPWSFTTINLNDYDGVLTDVFYFTRPLEASEVRYVALNGIDSAQGTEVSGIIGGFIHGQGVGSGLIGGYSRGLDTGSGLIGGYVPGSIAVSGLMGGYVSGVVFGMGTIGGFVQGSELGSGLMAGYIVGVQLGSGMIAGYIRGQSVGSGLFGGIVYGSTAGSGLVGGLMFSSDRCSGLFGGYMLGGLQGRFEFDASFTVEVLAAEDFDAQLEIAKTASSDFDAKLIIFQNEAPPLVNIIIPNMTVSGLMPPFNQYFIGIASGQQGKTIAQTRWNFGDLTPTVTVAESGAGLYPVQHYFASSGFYIVRFTAIDSDGLHASATRVVHAASGIDPVIVSLSGVPRSGNAGLIVDFTTVVDILPPSVSIVAKLLSFDDGQATTAFSPTHVYTEPGVYKPIWCVRDSRGVIWCDSLEAGSDLLTSGGA